MNDLQNAVASFLAARKARPHWLPIPDDQRPMTLEAGYHLQKLVHEALEAAGDKRLGYKIGATSKSGQRTYGIDEPVYAGLFASTHAPDLADALAAPLRSPSLECEIAFRLKADINGADPDLSREDLINAIASCHIACEIIDNRYGDPLSAGVPTLLADDFFHASFVMGDTNLAWPDLDLTNLNASIEIDGAVIAGHSTDVLDAISALHWLVFKLASNGLALHTGDIVMSGTIVRPTSITPPANSTALSIDGFRSLTLAG